MTLHRGGGAAKSATEPLSGLDNDASQRTRTPRIVPLRITKVGVAIMPMDQTVAPYLLFRLGDVQPGKVREEDEEYRHPQAARNRSRGCAGSEPGTGAAKFSKSRAK